MNRATMTLSLAAILIASVLAGAGIYAYFSDTETSTGNIFQAGTTGCDLELSPCGTQSHLPFGVSDIKPSDSGVADVNLHNAGEDGWLSMKIINCVNDENGLLEPEAEAGDTTLDVGELSSKLYLEIWFDDNNDGERQVPWPGGEQPITEGYVDDLCGVKILIDGDPTYDVMESGMTWTIGIKWSLASEVGNIIQSDSLTFDIEFTLSESEP